MSLEDEERHEMMVIEIAFGSGSQQVEDVLVHWGDNPQDLAEEFVRKHNLRQNVIPAIAGHIGGAIEEFVRQTSELQTQTPPPDDIDDDDIKKLDSDDREVDPEAVGLMFSDDDMQPSSPQVPEVSAPVTTSVAESSAAPTSPDDMARAEERRLATVRQLARVESLKNTTSPGSPSSSSKPLIKDIVSASGGGDTAPKFSPSNSGYKFFPSEPTTHGSADENTADVDDTNATGVTSSSVTPAHTMYPHHHPMDHDLDLGAGGDVHVNAPGIDMEADIMSPMTEASADDSTFADNESIVESDNVSSGHHEAEGEQHRTEEVVPMIDGMGGFVGVGNHRTALYPASGSETEREETGPASLHDRLAEAINRGLKHAQSDPQQTGVGFSTEKEGNSKPKSNVDAGAGGVGAGPSTSSSSTMEGMYNRLKSDWTSDDRSVSSSVLSDLSMHMKPVSSSMSLTKGGSGKNSKLSSSHLGKSTNTTASQVSNRLYSHAMNSKLKNEARTEAALAQFDQMRADHRFHMNARSRQMTKGFASSGKPGYVEVGHRLHEEGVKEIRERQDISDTKSKIPLPESWSCSRCAHLHDISPKILHDIDENIVKYRQKVLRGMDRRTDGTTAPLTAETLEKEILRGVKITQICEQCGWDQTHVRPHRPCNVAKHLLLKGDKYKQQHLRENNVNRGEMKFRHRGATSSSSIPKISIIDENEEESYVARAGFFEEMHQNAAGEARKLEAMQTRLTDMEEVLTFRPTIPSSSRELLRESIARDKTVAEQHRITATGSSLSNAERESKYGIKGRSKDMILETKDLATPPVSEYFSLAPAERLYRNKIPNKVKDRRIARKIAEEETIQRELAELEREKERQRQVEAQAQLERDADATAIVEFERNNELLRMGCAPGKAGKGSVTRPITGKGPIKKLPIKTGSAAANLSLSAAEHAAQQRKVVMFKTHYKSKAEVDQYVNQLTYEYRAREERKKKLANEVFNYDQQTHQKLFQPKVEPYVAAHGHSVTYASAQGSSGGGAAAHRDIFDDILRRDANALDKKKQKEVEKVKEEAQFIKRNQATASQHSVQLLREMTDKQTNEIFHTLCDHIGSVFVPVGQGGTMHGSQVVVGGEDGIILPEEGDDDEEDKEHGQHAREQQQLEAVEEEEQLNLMEITSDMLAEDVFSVVHEARNALLRKNHRRPLPAKPTEAGQIIGSTAMRGLTSGTQKPEKEPPLLISKPEFNKLIWQTLRQRKGVGNSYLAVRKKVPVVTMELLEKAQKEETFKPVVNETSTRLSQHKGGRGTKSRSIADILIADGKEADAKIERQRDELRAKEIGSLTFQPKMYPPPRYVSPRYRQRQLPPAVPSPESAAKMVSVADILAGRNQSPKQAHNQRTNDMELNSPHQQEYARVSGRGSFRAKTSSIDATYDDDDEYEEEEDGHQYYNKDDSNHLQQQQRQYERQHEHQYDQYESPLNAYAMEQELNQNQDQDQDNNDLVINTRFSGDSNYNNKQSGSDNSSNRFSIQVGRDSAGSQINSNSDSNNTNADGYMRGSETVRSPGEDSIPLEDQSGNREGEDGDEEEDYGEVCQGPEGEEEEMLSPEEAAAIRANEAAMLKRISVSGRASDVSALTDDAYQEDDMEEAAIATAAGGSPEYSSLIRHNRSSSGSGSGSGSSGSGTTGSTSTGQGYSLNMDMIVEGRDESLTPHDQARLNGGVFTFTQTNKSVIEEADESDNDEEEGDDEDGTVATHIKNPTPVHTPPQTQSHHGNANGKRKEVTVVEPIMSTGFGGGSSPSVRQQPAITRQNMNAPLTAAFISKSYSPLPVVASSSKLPSAMSSPKIHQHQHASDSVSSINAGGSGVSSPPLAVTISPSVGMRKTNSNGIASGKSTPVSLPTGSIAKGTGSSLTVQESTSGMTVAPRGTGTGSASASRSTTPTSYVSAAAAAASNIATSPTKSPVSSADSLKSNTDTSVANPSVSNARGTTVKSSKSQKKKDGNKSTFKTLFGIS